MYLLFFLIFSYLFYRFALLPHLMPYTINVWTTSIYFSNNLSLKGITLLYNCFSFCLFMFHCIISFSFYHFNLPIIDYFVSNTQTKHAKCKNTYPRKLWWITRVSRPFRAVRVIPFPSLLQELVFFFSLRLLGFSSSRLTSKCLNSLTGPFFPFLPLTCWSYIFGVGSW